jgi:hypothetical protein
VQTADRALLKKICKEIWGRDDFVKVKQSELEYVVKVETDEERVKVRGIPDAIVKAHDAKLLVWECKKLSFASFSPTNYRQVCFAIRDAIRVFESIYSRYPLHLCGILSSGRMFVLIQASLNDGGEYAWKRSEMVNLFNNRGTIQHDKCTALANMLSHACVMAEGAVPFLDAATITEDDEFTGEDSTGPDLEGKERKLDKSSIGPTTRSQGGTLKSSAATGSTDGKKTSSRGALLDIPCGSLTLQNVECNRRFRSGEEDKYKLLRKAVV